MTKRDFLIAYALAYANAPHATMFVGTQSMLQANLAWEELERIAPLAGLTLAPEYRVKPEGTDQE